MAINERPLFRGYIGERSKGFTPRLESRIDLMKEYQRYKRQNMLFDAEKPQYSGKFIWATPKENYARNIAIARYVVKGALFPEFDKKAGSGEIVPAYVSFVPEREDLFISGFVAEPVSTSIEYKRHSPDMKNSNFIAQRIDPQKMNVWIASRTSLDLIYEFRKRLCDTKELKLLKDYSHLSAYELGQISLEDGIRMLWHLGVGKWRHFKFGRGKKLALKVEDCIANGLTVYLNGNNLFTDFEPVTKDTLVAGSEGV